MQWNSINMGPIIAFKIIDINLNEWKSLFLFYKVNTIYYTKKDPKNSSSVSKRLWF